MTVQSDSTVLVTGATGGIGRAIAHALHGRGATVLLTGRRVDVLDQIARELGDRVEVVGADLSNRADVERLGERGDVDVLVANAALPAVGPAADVLRAGAGPRDGRQRARADAAHAGTAVRACSSEVRGISSTSPRSRARSRAPAAPSTARRSSRLRGFGSRSSEELRETGGGGDDGLPRVHPGSGDVRTKAERSSPAGSGRARPVDVAKAVVEGIERTAPRSTSRRSHSARARRCSASHRP